MSRRAVETLLQPHPDLVRCRLVVEADTSAQIDGFSAAVSGQAGIPWRLDFDHLEDEWFARIVMTNRPERARLSAEAARSLARSLRTAAERRNDAFLGGRAAPAPFDPMRVVPLPARVLSLGPDDPEAQSVMFDLWGIGREIRRVSLLNGRSVALRRLFGEPQRRFRWAVEFWSPGWAPWRLIASLVEQHSALTIRFHGDA